MKHVRGLAFDQDPNYPYIRKLFEGAMYKNGWTLDYNYDWLIRKMERVRELNPQAVEEQKKVKEVKKTKILKVVSED